MNGILYKHNEHYSESSDAVFGDSFFCVEESGKKVHVSESFRTEQWGECCREEWIKVIGPCDGSCIPPTVELDSKLERAVKNYTAGVREEVFATDVIYQQIAGKERTARWTDCSDDETVEAQIAVSLALSVATKVNRWARRYRWTRKRRLVTDFS